MRIYIQKILKVVRTITHPLPLITFLLIFPIIPGQWNSFYFYYILEGLQSLEFYAFTAVAGIGLLLYSLIRYKRKNYFDREVLKAKCKWAWYNTFGLMFISFSLVSFYHLDSTPSFRESIENDYFFITYLLFVFMCRLFLGFNLAFVIFSVIPDRVKAKYYDDDDFYGDLNNLDDYREI